MCHSTLSDLWNNILCFITSYTYTYVPTINTTCLETDMKRQWKSLWADKFYKLLNGKYDGISLDVIIIVHTTHTHILFHVLFLPPYYYYYWILFVSNT